MGSPILWKTAFSCCFENKNNISLGWFKQTVGLFGIFELGLLDMKCHVIDNLDKIDGQCSELYPEKPIYDIPSRVEISAQKLVDDLMDQCKPFNPVFHLNQNAEKLEKNTENEWTITTSENNSIIANT